jgi:glc operon protein GlcG
MRNAVAGSLAFAAIVLLGQSAQAQLLEKKALSLAAARKMVAAAEAEAERNQWRGVIAIVDDGGWLILLERMDHAAMTASVELAEGKARSAALFKKPTQALEEAINNGRYAAITARGFIEMQGGLPVLVDGEVIGGIGASFATPEEDEQIAKAGLAALAQWLRAGRVLVALLGQARSSFPRKREPREATNRGPGHLLPRRRSIWSSISPTG